MSKSIINLKTDYQQKLRERTAPGSILRSEDATMRDDVANELRDRGMITVADTTALQLQSTTNSKYVHVLGIGIFQGLVTGETADNDALYPSADAGTLWELFIDAQGNNKFYEVGVTANGPAPGGNTWNLRRFKNKRVVLIVDDVIYPSKDPGTGGAWVYKPLANTLMILNNGTFEAGQQIIVLL